MEVVNCTALYNPVDSRGEKVSAYEACIKRLEKEIYEVVFGFLEDT